MNNNLSDNIIKLSSYYQLESSKEYLDILYLQLKFLKNQIRNLDNYKPFFFQKKKMKKYLEEKKDLENKVSKCQNDIQYELSLMAKINEG